MKIIYIASAAHSGSTLLDLMLNAHSRIVTVGEIKKLALYTRGYKAHKRCTCGSRSVLQCPFWNEVGAAIAELSPGRTLADLDVDSDKDLGTFHADNRLLFQAVGKVSGADIIVDSSKSRGRLEMLLATPGLEVFPVFLVRNPKGQILSLSRSAERKKKESAADFGKFISNYSIMNVAIHQLLRRRPHFKVRYEQLVQRPAEVLSSLMTWIGVEYEPQQLNFADHERHNIDGNRMRRHSSSEIRLDDSWRRELNLIQKITIDIGTLPGRFPFLTRRGRAGN